MFRNVVTVILSAAKDLCILPASAKVLARAEMHGFFAPFGSLRMTAK
jgi:hypothetical protein